MNFLPSVQDITKICEEINEEIPINLYFLTDRYLHGLDGPEFRDSALRGHMRVENDCWTKITGEPLWSARNPHIHSFIIREPTEAPLLPDVTGEWFFRWEIQPGTTLIGRWHRQALSSTVLVQLRPQEKGVMESYLFEIVDRGAERFVMRCQSSGRIFACVPQSQSRLLVTVDPPGNTFVARRLGRSLRRVI